jgi:hypothetical protein
VRRLLVAVASGAVGMMLVAHLATVLTLAPLGAPEPWELTPPPTVAGSAEPAASVAPDPAVAAVVSGLPAPPGRATEPAVAATTTAPRPGSPARPAARAGDVEQPAAAPTPVAAPTVASAPPAAVARDAKPASGGSSSAPAPLAKVCLQVVGGVCVQLG